MTPADRRHAPSDPLLSVRIVSVGDRPWVQWAEGLCFKLPAAVIERAGWTTRVGPEGDLAVPPRSASVTEEDVGVLRERAAFTTRRPLSAYSPVHYHAWPAGVRAAVASLVGRWHRQRVDRWAAFPAWPIDLSADLLADLVERPRARPERRPLQSTWRTPVVLTHDIDSPEGLSNLASFLAEEEAVGASSTSYVVPCRWAIDHGRVQEILTRGHQVGVHGYDHANRTPFAGDAERHRRLDAARTFVERYGVIGYRAPSLLRTRALLCDLGRRYRYDSSIPTSGGLFPVPNNGCATVRPFVIEGIVELPVTLPRDGSLRFLGHSPDAIARIWIECADLVGRARGVVVLLTHCERRFSGNPAMMAAYRRFLEYVSLGSDRFTFSTPAEVLHRLGAAPDGGGLAG